MLEERGRGNAYLSEYTCRVLMSTYAVNKKQPSKQGSPHTHTHTRTLSFSSKYRVALRRASRVKKSMHAYMYILHST